MAVQLMLVLALIFALAVAAFAVQNAEAITVQFLQWETRTSLVVVILAAAALGALSAGLVGTVRQVGLGLRLRHVQTQAQRLEKELADLREDKAELQQEVQRLDRELEETRRVGGSVPPPVSAKSPPAGDRSSADSSG